jgi:hypothetical protein
VVGLAELSLGGSIDLRGDYNDFHLHHTMDTPQWHYLSSSDHNSNHGISELDPGTLHQLYSVT